MNEPPAAPPSLDDWALPELEAAPMPAPPSIPVCEPSIEEAEIQAVVECLKSGWISTVSPLVAEFEARFAERVGVDYAVATCSGTAALHVALLVAGIEPGDEVLVPDLTFIAPVNAIRFVGAYPVFIDVDPVYWQMDPEAVADFLTNDCLMRKGVLRNRTTGRRITAVLPVDILGHPVDLEPILTAAGQVGIPVIEDAAESLGAKYRNRPVGRLADATCYSFNGNKVITTGGGGMFTTNNSFWAERARYLTTQAREPGDEFVHGEMGFNYRLTGLQAALGMAQLRRLSAHVRAKRAIAEAYREAFAEIDGIYFQAAADWAYHARWLSAAWIEPGIYGMDRRALARYLATLGIETRPLWQPMHRSPAHRKLKPRECPQSQVLYDSVLCLPSSVGMQPDQQDRVIDAIRDIVAPPSIQGAP